MRLPLSPFQARLAACLSSRSPATVSHPNAWWAAVAVILVGDPDVVLVIRRATRASDPWSGHMGLPGGRLDPGDHDLQATAIRETAEEVGIRLGGGQLIGSLDDVSPRTPTLRPTVVRPFVFALSHRPPLELSPEVALAVWIELTEFIRPGVSQEVEIPIRGESRSFPAYRIGPHLIWGLTERILTQVLHLTPAADPTVA